MASLERSHSAPPHDDLDHDASDLARLVRELPEAVIVHRRGHIVFANRATARMFGAAMPGALIGLPILSFIPPESRDEVRAMTRTWDAGGTAPPLQHKAQRLDGAIYDLETTGTAVDWKGAPAVLLVARDLTERRRTEAALRESEDLHRRLVELLPEAVFIQDGERIAYINPACLAVLGARSADEVIGRSPYDFVHPEDRDAVATRMRQVLDQRATMRFIRRRRRRLDGSEFLAEVGALYLPHQGKPSIMVMLRDVTEQVRATEALHRSNAELSASEERYRRLAELLPDALYIHNGSAILFINPSGVRMFGAESAEQIIGRSPLDFCHPSDRSRVSTGASDVLNQKMSRESLRRRRLRIDGSEYLADVSAVHIDWHGEPAVLVAVRDVTEQVRAAEELSRSNAELQQFAYVASHDLQEPLRTVASYCQLLERRCKTRLDESGLEYLNFAVSGAKRMQMLISDLLEFSRVGTRAKPFAPTDLNKVFADAVSNLDRAIGDAAGAVSADPLPTVDGDAVQLTQLLQNLIGNAIKFRGQAPPAVTVGAARQGDEWVISVEDNGIGIEPQHRERIFQIFQRLHERDKYEGTGIGLAVCKKIVERHGGRIWVEGESGRGSVFRFTFPALDG